MNPGYGCDARPCSKEDFPRFNLLQQRTARLSKIKPAPQGRLLAPFMAPDTHVDPDHGHKNPLQNLFCNAGSQFIDTRKCGMWHIARCGAVQIGAGFAPGLPSIVPARGL
jgi:hypothetical protein